ncbi:MAG: hypothetical protein WCV71_02585 [Patescibacteria group bacterium]|jgi:hypothetical protein
MNKTLSFAARGFAILFIIITGLFALDIGKFSWWGLFMHLLPSLILLVILIISWKYEKIGGILWLLAAMAYVVLVWGKVDWLTYLIMTGPILVIAILFLWPKKEAVHLPKLVTSSSKPIEVPVVNQK